MHQVFDISLDEEKVDTTRVYRDRRLIPITLSFFIDLDQSVIDTLKGKLIEQMEKDLIYGN